MFSEEKYEDNLFFCHFTPPNCDQDTHGISVKGEFRFHPTISSRLLILTVDYHTYHFELFV